MNEFLRHCYFLNADFPPFQMLFPDTNARPEDL